MAENAAGESAETAETGDYSSAMNDAALKESEARLARMKDPCCECGAKSTCAEIYQGRINGEYGSAFDPGGCLATCRVAPDAKLPDGRYCDPCLLRHRDAGRIDEGPMFACHSCGKFIDQDPFPFIENGLPLACVACQTQAGRTQNDQPPILAPTPPATAPLS